MEHAQKILISGVKPTGRPHVGNYFGAMKQFVDLQKDYKSFVMVADYHALTTVHDREALAEDIVGVTLDYLAIGLDPEHVTLFKQSDISEHSELAWIFDCITTVPYLMRGHAYKDAAAKNKEITVGVFNYPMLMAADILLYDADIVPVGSDQKQHIEYARDTAEKFNRTFGETFKLPTEHIIEQVGTVPGTDGRKMSKSYKNTIPLFAEDNAVKVAAMSIPTDSKGINEPKDTETCKVFALHKLFTTGEELAELTNRYQKGGIGYKESKEILIKNVIAFITPLRERRSKLEQDREYVLHILAEGGKKAKEVAMKKMLNVRKKIGVTL